MRKKTSLMLKRAAILLAILAVVAYFLVPKIVENYMESASVTGIEEFDYSPETERESEAIEIISDEQTPITKVEEQDTMYTHEEEEIQSVDSALEEPLTGDSGPEEPLGNTSEKDRLRKQEDAEREQARHKRMESSVDKFIENVKSPDWYK